MVYDWRKTEGIGRYCTYLDSKKAYMVATHCKGGLGADWNEDRCSYQLG